MVGASGAADASPSESRWGSSSPPHRTSALIASAAADGMNHNIPSIPSLEPPKRHRSFDSNDKELFDVENDESSPTSYTVNSTTKKLQGDDEPSADDGVDLFSPPQLKNRGSKTSDSSLNLSQVPGGSKEGTIDDSFTTAVGDEALPIVELDRRTSEYRWSSRGGRTEDVSIMSPTQAKRKLSNEGMLPATDFAFLETEDEKEPPKPDNDRGALSEALKTANKQIALIEQRMKSLKISATNREVFIEKELNFIVADANSNHLVLPFEEEKLEALHAAAKRICYVMKYYDALEDRFVYLPSVAKSIVNFSLILETEKLAFIPSVYRAALRSSARMAILKEEAIPEYMERLSVHIKFSKHMDRRAATKSNPMRRRSTGGLKGKVAGSSRIRSPKKASKGGLLGKVFANGSVRRETKPKRSNSVGALSSRKSKSKSRSSPKNKSDAESSDLSELDLSNSCANDSGGSSLVKAKSKGRLSTGTLRDKSKSKSKSSSKLKGTAGGKSELNNKLNINEDTSTLRTKTKPPKRRGSTGNLKDKGGSKSRSQRVFDDLNDASKPKSFSRKEKLKTKDGKKSKKSASSENEKLKKKPSMKKSKSSSSGKDGKRDKLKERSSHSKKNPKKQSSKRSNLDENMFSDPSETSFFSEDSPDWEFSIGGEVFTTSDLDDIKVDDTPTSGDGTVAAKRHRNRAVRKQQEWNASIHSLLADD